jgi:type VI protein secretion system component VasK
MAEQDYATHRRFVPGFHFVAFGILVINLIWQLFRLVRGLPGVPLFDRLVGVAVAVALVLLAWYARTFPLRAQDRIIRLEEALRMERLLPPDLRGRIGELTTGQLIALRFASDEELPELTRAVLDGEIKGREEIKKKVRSWRADDLRM